MEAAGVGAMVLGALLAAVLLAVRHGLASPPTRSAPCGTERSHPDSRAGPSLAGAPLAPPSVWWRTDAWPTPVRPVAPPFQGARP
jgi:hypothetical protein